MQNTTAAATALNLVWSRSTDDYGRSVHLLIDWTGGTYTTIGAVYAVPRATRDLLGYTHGSNDWTRADRGPRSHVEHQSLAEAKARLVAVATAIHAA